METLKSIAVSVSGVIVFGSVCEMILPSGVYKKYILLSIGLMLICTLISPFVGSRADLGDGSLPEVFAEQSIKINPEDRQNKDIIRIYKQRLCENMTEKISDIAGVDLDIKCEISESEETFGSIERIYLTVFADESRISDSAVNLLKSEYGLTDSMIDIKYVKDLTNR